jgi:hypothetical protein
MTVQTVATVTVTVANANSMPRDFPQNGTSAVVTSVKVGSDVKADLTGDGFTIARIGGDDGSRVLADASSASWSWQVTPQASGPRTLYLSLYVRVKGPDGSPVDVRTFRQDVTVAVNPSYTIVDFLKTWWPASGLTIPVVLGAVWLWLKKGRRTTSPPEPAPPMPGPAPTPDGAGDGSSHH